MLFSLKLQKIAKVLMRNVITLINFILSQNDKRNKVLLFRDYEKEIRREKFAVID